ncbi:MAG: YbjN domain-containing protein [Cyanobacteria bacterium J06641_5]
MNANNRIQNRLNIFAAGICIAAATIAIAPRAQALSKKFKTITGEEIVEFLQDRGYEAELEEDSEGDPRISGSNAEGVRFTIDFYECDREDEDRPCGSVQFLSGFDLPDPGMSAEEINDWNARFRFGRALVDEEGDPILRLDVELNGGATRNNFEEWLNRWETSLSSFLNHIGWNN